EAQALPVAEAGPGVSQQAAAIQRGSAGAQAQGMTPAPQVVSGDIEGSARGETGLAGRRLQTGRATSDAAQLRAGAERQRVPGGFVHIVDDVFVVRLAIGILNGRIHSGEY